jgi:glycosyltransferase involved in cell wall biosynthesis
MGVRGPGTRHDALYARLFERLLRIPTLRALATIDETLPPYVRQQRITGWDKVHHVPDVARLNGRADRAAARASLGIAPDNVVVLAYGALEPRKGIAELIAAAASPVCSTRVVVLLAGRQDAFVRDLLTGTDAQQLRAARRLVEVSGFLGDQQELDVFSAADIVWVAYRGFYGASGVLIQAGSMRLPVVACEDGLIGWTAQRHGLGELVDPASRESVTGAINRLAGDDSLRRTYGENGAQLAAAHTPEAFGMRLCDIIASAVRPAKSVHR